MLKKIYQKINNPFFLPIMVMFVAMVLMNCVSVFAKIC